jgi:hypothetical protein
MCGILNALHCGQRERLTGSIFQLARCVRVLFFDHFLLGTAIEAVLWPATERTWPGADKYLYFVATGKGTSDFSKTYEEHAQKAERYSKSN